MMPRIKGFINSFGARRPQDKMHDLASKGYVDRDYITAWTYLRNRHVHPKLKDLKKPDAAAMQELLDLIHRVETLLRQLTFYLINYSGPFTDYGTSGFPTKQYPLPPSPSTPAGEEV